MKDVGSDVYVGPPKLPLIQRFKKAIKKYWMIYVLFLPAAAFFIVFAYGPMYGIILAFKDFSPRHGIVGSPFVDPLFTHFTYLFQDDNFYQVVFNTLRISFLGLVFGFPAPIILSLLYNEVRLTAYKRTVQAIAYAPNFISWVVLAGMVRMIFSNSGMINSILNSFGVSSVPFLTEPNWFLFTLIFTSIWKSVGFSTIIYMAAVSSIDMEQYEAATIDGANRIQKMRYITIPGMSIALSINLILTLAGIFDANFDQIFNLYSPLVYDTADIIDTYVYRMGIVAGNYEISTALGLAKSLVGLVLIIFANKMVQKLGGEGVW